MGLELGGEIGQRVGQVVAASGFGVEVAGGVASVYTDGGTEAAWTNPSFATDETLGNANATLDADAAPPVLKSEWLRINSLGIEIPATATVRGIELQARCKHTDATETARIEMRLTTGTDKSDHLNLGTGSETVTLSGTPFQEVSVGSSTELWGRAWTPGQINSLAFGLAAQMRIDGAGVSATDVNRIAVLRVAVTYTLPTAQQGGNRSRDRGRGR